ncbi:MAG TPA: hypothetical protein ENH82_02905 [bacterium]|nr:hypothetical protein [bacterium]
MNKFKKITVGFVIQEYEQKDGKYICAHQEFIAGDQVDREDGYGEPIEIDTSKEVYQSFGMKQPTAIKDYYLLFIWRGVDLKLFGSFETVELRDERARELREDHGSLSNYYPLEVSTGAKVNIGSFPNSFFEE